MAVIDKPPRYFGLNLEHLVNIFLYYFFCSFEISASTRGQNDVLPFCTHIFASSVLCLPLQLPALPFQKVSEPTNSSHLSRGHFVRNFVLAGRRSRAQGDFLFCRSLRESAMAAGEPVHSLFGLLVAGRPVSTDFTCVAPGSRYTVLVPSPASAPQISLFLLPGNTFPAGAGITVMWALPPYEAWTPLGVLTPSAPSATFRTGWASALAPPAPQPPPATAMLGLAVEPLDAVASVGSALAAADADRLAYAQLVARDLHSYLSSYAQPTPLGERLVLPPTAIEKWQLRFTEKFRRDPDFLFKSSL